MEAPYFVIFIIQSDLYLTNAAIRKAFSVNGGLVVLK